MLDDDARRALEEEAIALVSLSRPPLRLAPQNMQQQQQQQVGKATCRSGDHDKRQATSNRTDAGESDDGPGEEELYAQEQPSQSHPQDGGSISMKSLLVTLKKRKLRSSPSEDATESEQTAKVLPSFRDVFEPPRQSPPPPPQQQQQHTGESSSQPVEPQAAPPATASTNPTELKYKCKYRTGKCNNVRALKSCGDYHNLCNYHRLRANANQRKLDRKKKVQRLQVVPAGAAAAAAAAAAAVAAMASAATAEPGAAAAPPASASIIPSTTLATASSASSSPASVASALLCAPSVAAAVALVAMPSLHQHQHQHTQRAATAAPVFAAAERAGRAEQQQQ